MVEESAHRGDTILFKTVSRFSRRGQVDAAILEHLWRKGIRTEFADPGLVWPDDESDVRILLDAARTESELKAGQLAAMHTFLKKTGGTVDGAKALLVEAGVLVCTQRHHSFNVPAPTFGGDAAVDWREHSAFDGLGAAVPDFNAPLLAWAATPDEDCDGDDVSGMRAPGAAV